MNVRNTRDSKQLFHAFQSSMLFKNLDKSYLEELSLEYAHLQQSYSKGSIIYSENDICTHMDLVVEGTLVIQQIDEYGNMLSITQFHQGQTIAANTLFSQNKLYPMTISAVNHVRLLALSKKEVLKLCENKIFLEAFLVDISRRAAILTHTIKNITRKTLRNKIIDYLIVLYTKQNSTTLILPVTKTDLANSFGVARPSLSRELSQMKKDGLLSYNRNTILISDAFIKKHL